MEGGFGLVVGVAHLSRREGQQGDKDAPCTLIIKEAICPLFIFLGNILRLLMSLKPCLVLLVKPPALLFKCLGSMILLWCALPIIEDVE